MRLPWNYIGIALKKAEEASCKTSSAFKNNTPDLVRQKPLNPVGVSLDMRVQETARTLVYK